MSKLNYDIILEANNIIIGKDSLGYFWSKISDSKYKYLYKVTRLNLEESDFKGAIEFLIKRGQNE
jgi:hypothetical protein